MTARSKVFGIVVAVGLVAFIPVLSYYGVVPWSDFASAIASSIVLGIPAALGLAYKDELMGWLNRTAERRAGRPTIASPRAESSEHKAELKQPLVRVIPRRRPGPDTVIGFLVGGLIALFGAYVVNLIITSFGLSVKYPVTILILPYVIGGLGVFLLVLFVASIVMYLR